jgi:hypothetical protein
VVVSETSRETSLWIFNVAIDHIYWEEFEVVPDTLSEKLPEPRLYPGLQNHRFGYTDSSSRELVAGQPLTCTLCKVLLDVALSVQSVQWPLEAGHLKLDVSLRRRSSYGSSKDHGCPLVSQPWDSCT